jgi:spoIIIJ-associated protein
MLKRIEFEAKSEVEALELAVEKLGIAKDKIALKTTRDKKGFFSSGTTLYEATPNIDLVEEGKNYVSSVLEAFGVDFEIEVKVLDEGNELYYSVQSNENALLIGREGRTLLALQFLLRQNLVSFSQTPVRIQLDIANYHENHRKQLEILATRTAKEVVKTGKQVKLDPMSPFDRRIVHAKLSEWRDVTTQSEGEGENRALIIKPVK